MIPVITGHLRPGDLAHMELPTADTRSNTLDSFKTEQTDMDLFILYRQILALHHHNVPTFPVYTQLSRCFFLRLSPETSNRAAHLQRIIASIISEVYSDVVVACWFNRRVDLSLNVVGVRILV